MVEDALDLLAAAPAELGVGVAVDYGEAFVGNVGSGEVKDFTAIGDVVNTAARLQACAGDREVVVSSRVAEMTEAGLPNAAPRTFELKGKAAPEQALVVTSGARLP